MKIQECTDSTSVLYFAYAFIFLRGEFGPSSGGGARWCSDGGGDAQTPLQLQSMTGKGGYSGIPSVSLRRRGWLYGVIVGGIPSSRRPFS